MAAGLLLAACVQQSSGGTDAAGATEPSTARSLAALTIEYVGLQPNGVGPLPRLPKRAVGAELRFKGDGEHDGDAVYIAVEPAGHLTPTNDLQTCLALPDGRDGAKVAMCFQREEPEEDPGVVKVSETRKHERDTASFFGPVINRDPRQVKSYFPVSQMAKLADDPRVGLRTTPDAIAKGKALKGWGATGS